jgi:acyl-CoA synthetase (AMP-forming)/AMP-acid ligase II
VGPDTGLKILFTSGSTRMPKGVTTTHRMLCANQQMLRQSLVFLTDEPPVLVDWLPWNHVFGGSHNIGIVLVNGGTLYIDDGKPTPEGIAPTLRNLREISPTVYFNVPKGLEMIAQAMRNDTVLRDSLFRRCQAMTFAGAGLSQAVWDELDRHAEAAIGERLRMITGLGMTEAAPTCTFAVGTDTASGHIGLPVPGVEVKLVKDASTGGTLVPADAPLKVVPAANRKLPGNLPTAASNVVSGTRRKGVPLTNQRRSVQLSGAIWQQSPLRSFAVRNAMQHRSNLSQNLQLRLRRLLRRHVLQSRARS